MVSSNCCLSSWNHSSSDIKHTVFTSGWHLEAGLQCSILIIPSGFFYTIFRIWSISNLYPLQCKHISVSCQNGAERCVSVSLFAVITTAVQFWDHDFLAGLFSQNVMFTADKRKKKLNEVLPCSSMRETKTHLATHFRLTLTILPKSKIFTVWAVGWFPSLPPEFLLPSAVHSFLLTPDYPKRLISHSLSTVVSL